MNSIKTSTQPASLWGRMTGLLSPSKEIGVSAPRVNVEQEFKDSFETGYEPRFCGKNIKNFVAKLPPAEMEGAKVLGIENKGFSYFGMVRAMHARDTKGDGTPYATDRNWHHHVVLEKEGKIYDFDFGLEPKVLPVPEYFSQMFFVNDKHVKPEEKCKDYQVQVIEAAQYVSGKEDSSKKIRLGEYLKPWGNTQTFTTKAA
jgi:hypothetical protein